MPSDLGFIFCLVFMDGENLIFNEGYLSKVKSNLQNQFFIFFLYFVVALLTLPEKNESVSLKMEIRSS